MLALYVYMARYEAAVILSRDFKWWFFRLFEHAALEQE
jgi:hypothetical protein